MAFFAILFTHSRERMELRHLESLSHVRCGYRPLYNAIYVTGCARQVGQISVQYKAGYFSLLSSHS